MSKERKDTFVSGCMVSSEPCQTVQHSGSSNRETASTEAISQDVEEYTWKLRIDNFDYEYTGYYKYIGIVEESSYSVRNNGYSWRNYNRDRLVICLLPPIEELENLKKDCD